MMSATAGLSLLGSDISSVAADVADRLLASLVFVRSRHGSGSGVIWERDGLIVTNNHVVHGDTADVILRDGSEFKSKVFARDPQHDLAALRVEANDLPAATIGDSTRVRVGQLVLAVGNPRGIRNVVTAGIVTGVGQVTGEHGPRFGDLIQADVALEPGNSGGPLADVEGRILGINSMISAAGIALAIPAEVVRAFAAYGSTGHPYIGIGGVPVRVRLEGQERGALLITLVEEGSPADRGGLLQGDVLLAFDNQPVATGEEFRSRLLVAAAGAGVRLHVLRGATRVDLTVVPTVKALA